MTVVPGGAGKGVRQGVCQGRGVKTHSASTPRSSRNSVTQRTCECHGVGVKEWRWGQPLATPASGFAAHDAAPGTGRGRDSGHRVGGK